nr:flagellar hook-associated protein FlgL [uncultured Tolumonas sp.]
MRVTTNMSYQTKVRSIQSASERLDKANLQMTTGDKFSTSGENVSGMSQKMALSTKIASYQQYATNSSVLDSNLTLEGTALDSITTTLQSAYTLVQRANNDSLSDDDKTSIGNQLEELQTQLYDLMNSKNSDGEYIFSGSQSQTQPFTKGSNGIYVYNGDATQKLMQVSDNDQIASNDSGQSVFQQVATRRTVSTSDSALTLDISSQSQFDTYYKNNYDPTSSGNNDITLSTTAGSPNQYTITDSQGHTQSGEYIANEAIVFNGISLKSSVAAGAAAQVFSLDKPKNDNILNTMGSLINALKDPSSKTKSQMSDLLADTEEHINNTLDKVNVTSGAVGGRQSSLEQILSSNTTLNSIATSAKANASEIDIYEAVSNVSKEQNALTVAQKAFTQISQSTLFDYI